MQTQTGNGRRQHSGGLVYRIRNIVTINHATVTVFVTV